MRKQVLLSLLALGLATWSTSLVSAATQTKGGWIRDVDQALEVAQARQQPILLFVSMDGCKYCQKMVQTTFRNRQVLQTIGSQYVPAVIKNSERPDLMRQLQIRSFPTTLIVNPEGDVLHEMKGYVDAGKFEQQLVRIAGQPRSANSIAAKRPTHRQHTAPAPARSPFSFASFLRQAPRPAATTARLRQPAAARPAHPSHLHPSPSAHRGFQLPFGLNQLFGVFTVRR
jgi:thioredoxin-related protein